MPFPVDAYLARVERIVDELACSVLPALGPSAAAAQVLEAVEEFVYGQQRFRAAPCGRSALPVAGVVDHPGVYEDARCDTVVAKLYGCSGCSPSGRAHLLLVRRGLRQPNVRRTQH